MNVDLGIWGKLTRFVIFLFVIAGILMVGGWYLPLIKQNERMRRELQKLEARKEKEAASVKQNRAAMESLQNDPKAVERLVRERLGYYRPGEILVRFESPATNPAAFRQN